MATANQNSSLGQLQDLQQLIGLFSGGPSVTTSGSSTSTTSNTGTVTNTTQTNIDEEGVQRLINQMLSGPGGVTAISGGARGSGLYNSTTEAQLLNDLYARVAGEVSARTAPTVQTQENNTSQTTTATNNSTQTQDSGVSGRDMLLGLLGTSLARPLIGAGANWLAGGLNNLFGLGGASGAGMTSGFGSGIGAVSDLGFDGLTSGFGSSLGSMGGLSGAGLGSLGTSFFGGFNNNLAYDPVGMLGSALGGAAALGPVGMVAAPAAAIFGQMFSGLGDSVICTALTEKGLLDSAEYWAGRHYLQSLPEHVVHGYYTWGIPVAAKIKAGSLFWILVCTPVARSRTSLLAGKPGLHILGRITKWIGEPICGWIGKRYLCGVNNGNHAS